MGYSGHSEDRLGRQEEKLRDVLKAKRVFYSEAKCAIFLKRKLVVQEGEAKRNRLSGMQTKMCQSREQLHLNIYGWAPDILPLLTGKPSTDPGHPLNTRHKERGVPLPFTPLAAVKLL